MKVKPFYIRITKEITPQIVQDALDKCVEAGAIAKECARESSRKCNYPYEGDVRYWDSFGVNISGETFFWDVEDGNDNGKFGGIQNKITLDQLDEWLGIDKTETPEEKEVFDSMASNSELPNGSEWDGEGLPPAGVECEAVFMEHEHKGYGEFLVLGYHKNYVWLEYVGKLSNKSKHYTARIDLVKFRKPETPQQREERERDETIKIIQRDMEFSGSDYYAAKRLYDKGYRKAK